MPELLTVDSSVFVAALRKQEEYSDVCRTLVENVKNRKYLAMEPYTVLIEIAAAIKRRTGSQMLSERVVSEFDSINTVFFLDIDAARAKRAIEIAQRYSVRGMDAVVIQIAEEFGATLVSLDEEMLQNAKTIIKTSRPFDIG